MYLPRSKSINGFQPLLNPQEVLELKSERRRRFAVIFSACCCGVLLFGLIRNGSPNKPGFQHFREATQQHEHTLPTPLSIVDPSSRKFMNSLENKLYQELKEFEFLDHSFLEHTPEMPLLKLDKTLMTTLRQSLTLSWTMGGSEESPSLVDSQDVLALYCPAHSQHTAFLEAATLEQAAATSQQHGGTQENEWFIPSFPITKHESCEFRLFDRQYPNRLQLLAVSPTLSIPAAGHTPTGIHLAFSNAADEIVIQFHTAEKGTPLAMFGSESPTRKVEGATHTYTAADLCAEPANVTEVGKFQDPGMIHVVRLTNLEPNVEYVYKVGLASGQGIVWSEVYSFQSPPLVGPEQPSFSYVVYGDQGCPAVGWGPGGAWTSAMAAREHGIRAVHHFGDLAYVRS